MISTPHRQTAVTLINEAVTAGARRAKACAELEISDRTLRRWTKNGQVRSDQRPLVPRPEPANKLSAVERTAVLAVCNSEEFASLPPSQIVPNWRIRGGIWPRNSAFTASCTRKGSSITVAGQGQASGANRQQATRLPVLVRSGLGISPGCRVRSQACSSTCI